MQAEGSIAPLPLRAVGRTRLRVTTLGFGCAPLGGLYRSVSDTEAQAAIATAYHRGIRYFDVAPLYGLGMVEHRAGQGLRLAPRDDFVLSSKVGRLLRPLRGPVEAGAMYMNALPFEFTYDYGYDGVMRSVEASYQRLGMNRIDILFIHDVNRRWHGDAVERRFDEVMAGGYRALEELRRNDIVQAIGVGVNDAGMLVRFAGAGDFDCFMLAARYTLLEQDPLEELLPLCAARGISIMAAAPFASGILASGAITGAKYFYADAPVDVLNKTRRIEAVCARHDVPLPAAALQFALGHRAVASVVTGMSSAAEVAANVGHFTRPIPNVFWQDLKAEGLLRDDAPVPVVAKVSS